jgi:hypothetical protein
MFQAQNKGFTITFDNGVTVSVQFGYGNYCEKRFEKDSPFNHTSKDAEVLAWDKDDNELISPQGWQSPEQVLNLLNHFANL